MIEAAPPSPPLLSSLWRVRVCQRVRDRPLDRLCAGEHLPWRWIRQQPWGFAVAGRRSLFRDLDSGLRDDERELIQRASFPCDVATDDLVDQQVKVDIIFAGDPLESGEALGIDTIGDVNSGLKGFRVH